MSIDTNIEENVDIGKQIKFLWKNKNLIFISTILLTIFSYGATFFIPNKYISYSILKIVDQESSPVTPSFNSPSFGGLAQSVGLSVGKGSSDDILVVETIKSRTFLKRLLAYESVKEKLIERRNIDNPTYIKIYKKIYSKDLSVFINKDTGLIHISYKHNSPKFAKDFVSLIIQEINDVFREYKLDELDKARKYYEAEYIAAKEFSLKTSISYLLEKNINSSMLANVRSEYILRSVENPFIPEVKHSPNEFIITLLGAIYGFIIAITYILVRENFFSKEDKSN